MSGIKQNLTIGGTIGLLAIAGNALINSLGLWDRSVSLVAEEERRLTSLEERITAQQRQISEIRTLSADIRKEFASSSVGNNTVEIRRLFDRYNALNEKIESLPIGLDGGVNKKAIADAVQAAENRLTQRFSVQIGGLVDGAVEKAVENHVASVPAATGNSDIPIATVRKIHVAEKDCVYLPSIGKEFTIRLRPGTEFCMSPSQLYMTVSGTNSRGTVDFKSPYFGEFGCNKRFIEEECIIGKESGIKAYLLRRENIYKEKGEFVVDVKFEEIPL